MSSKPVPIAGDVPDEDLSFLEPETDADVLFARLPDPHTRDELCKLFFPLAQHLALRFRGRGEPVDDLIQVASIGLLKSIDRFDPGREVKFSTYATATIVGELKRHFRDSGWAIRLPRRLQENTLAVGKTVSELTQSLGRSPTVQEIAQTVGLSEEDVLEGMEAMHAASLVSLDQPSDDDDTPTRQLGMEDESFEILEGWASVAPIIKQLPPRERRILYLRFFSGLSQTQIAQELGISQMHVSRLLARTLAMLRSAVNGPDLQL